MSINFIKINVEAHFMRIIKKIFSLIFIILIFVMSVSEKTLYAKENIATVIDLQSPSAILMEASTGTVLFEKNSDEVRSPASITKIMTLILIFEAIENGKISFDDEVCTSSYAKSMGGSQVFLEEGEVQTVDTLIKCITVASGNDASVAMAEFISGSEDEFVKQMNQKAAQLGMKNTNFIDCCGLTSDTNHHTTARDVAVMSKELITKYPKIFDYTKIWMEDITHTTAQGSKLFTLSSTNKLLKQYQWTTGLKTGSTSVAKYCFSATASKDGIDLIAVIMGAPDFKIRFSEAKKLLEYGFSKTKIYIDENKEKLKQLEIKGGKEQAVGIYPEGTFKYLDIADLDFSKIEKKYEFIKDIAAPIEKGADVGRIVYSIDGKEIGYISILAESSVEKAQYLDYLKKVLYMYF